MQVLLSQNAITVYEIILILILAFLLIRQMKRSKDQRERRQISNMKMRNVQLEEKLKNPDRKNGWSKNQSPYDVQYMHEAASKGNAMPRYQMEIEVHTETSVQRYLFDLEQEVTIGRDERNVLTLTDKTVSRRSCSVFLKNQTVCLKCQNSSNPVCLCRGKKKQLIQDRTVKLQSKDVLTIGRTELHISLYEN